MFPLLSFDIYVHYFLGAAAIRQAASTSSLAIHGSPVCKPKLKTQTINHNNSNTSIQSPKLPKGDEEGAEKGRLHRNKNELFYSKDELDSDDELNYKPNKKEKHVEKLVGTTKNNDKSPLQLEKWKVSDISIKNGNQNETPKRKNRDNSKESVERKRIKHEKPQKPFNRLLEGVTLVISGIANPDRGNLRSMAISMGAKYKPDWDISCSHLM